MVEQLKLLLIEDSEDDAAIVQQELQRGGYALEIKRVETSQELTQALANKKWDVIISDYNLPHFSAPAALNLVQKTGRDIPFIVVTGAVKDEEAVAVMKNGAHDYIFKNNLKRLVPAVRREIKEKEERWKRKEAEDLIKLNEARLESLLSISQYSAENVREFLEYALDEVIRLTGSKIGYIYLYNEEKQEFTLSTWTKGVMQERSIVDSRTVIHLEKVGIWGEAVRQRKPIVMNDFQEPNLLKKGYPEGHAVLYRWMTVPVFSKGKIVAVTGLANKADEYNQADVRQATLLMDSVWKYLENKQSQEALKESEKKYSTLVEANNDGIIILENGISKFINTTMLKMTGYTLDESMNKPFIDHIAPCYRGQMFERYKKRTTGGKTENGYEIEIMAKDGSYIPVEINASTIQYQGKAADMVVIRNVAERKQIEEKLKRSYKQLQENFKAINQTISKAVELRDPYTAGHQGRVAQLARAITKEIHLPDEMADHIFTSGLIHDIGKISIPAEILSRPGVLNNLEYSLIKTHVQAGYDIINNIEFPYPIARWILEHHERLDGTGYPNGLTGGQISLEAQILAVADVVEAMASHRPYRAALGIDKALEEISSKRNIFYHADVVDACLKLFRDKGFKFA